MTDGYTVTLVLRRFEGDYLFVGFCWLIDSALQDVEDPPDYEPGFSDIMYGHLWDEVGKTSELEELWLHQIPHFILLENK